MRSLVQTGALRARIAVLDNRLDDAANWLRTGYAMARHASQGPFLIQSQFAAACLCTMMSTPTEDLIQAPGMPSLDLALVDRPTGVLDQSDALASQRFPVWQRDPSFGELDGPPQAWE